MTLQLNEIIKESFNVRSNKDRRKKVNKIIASYLDNTGIEYRKGYEFDTITSYDNMIKFIPKTLEVTK